MRIAPRSSSLPAACSTCVPSAHFSANKRERSQFLARASQWVRAALLARRVCWPRPETKAPPFRGAPNQTGWPGSDLGRLDLQEFAGTRDRDRPRLHRLRNLVHKVDVQEPVLQPRAFDLDMLSELVVALKSARGNAPMVRPRNRAQTSILVTSRWRGQPRALSKLGSGRATLLCGQLFRNVI